MVENRKPQLGDKNHRKISEGEIQRKLYGDIKPSIEKTEVPELKEIPLDKEPAKKHPEPAFPLPAPEKKASPNDLFFQKKQKIDSGIQSEIKSLKESILSLEGKLRDSEAQKERLKAQLNEQKKAQKPPKAPQPPLVLPDLGKILSLHLPKNIRIIAVIAVFCLFILMLLIFMPRSAPKAKPAKPKPPAVSSAPAQKSPPPQARETVMPASSAQNGKRFTIQAAEYADEAAAQKFIDKLKAQNIPVSIDTIYRGSDKNKPYYKINIGEFDTYDEAKKYNEQFRQKTSITDSFIKERK